MSLWTVFAIIVIIVFGNSVDSAWNKEPDPVYTLESYLEYDGFAILMPLSLQLTLSWLKFLWFCDSFPTH